ncbi:hypothetical protein Tco_0679205 [Tanacetum coccineum]|uniref:Uncharacterized protein n=1 Tax=Tanacetum coccineum TaxID=301880 RepID=A0ABQ4XHD2_9ASTR
MQEVTLFYNGLDVPTRQILDSKSAIPTKTDVDAKIVIQEMAEYSQKWHNGTSSKARSTKTSDGLAVIQAQLNNLGREIKKVNEKVYAAQELQSGPYVVSDAQYSSLSSETVLFSSRLHGYYCDDWKEARDVKILETFDHTLPQKEKDPGRFTLPWFIHDICFDEAIVDLGASVSVMPFSTYSNLRLGFSINEDMDITSGVVLGMPFCKRFMSCQKIMERSAHGDKCERMDE